MSIKTRRAASLKRRQQKGIALFLSLVMLLILTILGVSSVQTTSLQERMSRSALDSNMAFQSAEAAIHDAEDYIETNFDSLVAFDAPGANDAGLYYEAAWNETPNWENAIWNTGTGYREGVAVPGVVQPAQYIIEHVKTIVSDQDLLNLDNIGQDTGSGRVQIFRITTFGTGGTATARVMIQSTYGKKF